MIYLLDAYLASRGTPIGPNDLLIASIALANGLTIVTHNTSEFSRVSRAEAGGLAIKSLDQSKVSSPG